MIRSLILAGTLAVSAPAIAEEAAAPAPSRTAEVLRRYPAPEARQGVAVATLDAGIDSSQMAVQGTGYRALVVKVSHRSQIVAHQQNPSVFIFRMGTVKNPADNRPAKALQQWSKHSSWVTALANGYELPVLMRTGWHSASHLSIFEPHKEMPVTTDNRHNRIDNIEFNVHDITRSKAFYGAVFGWTFTDFGPTYSEFSDGRLSGGFTTGEPVRPGGPLIILYADDLAQAQQAISAAGGQITRPEFKFPGGSRFHFTDLDGYELAVWSQA